MLYSELEKFSTPVLSLLIRILSNSRAYAASNRLFILAHLSANWVLGDECLGGDGERRPGASRCSAMNAKVATVSAAQVTTIGDEGGRGQEGGFGL